MALALLLAFVLLPMMEIAVYIQVGEAIGVAATLAATIATAGAGVVLLRAQGFATLMKVRADLDANRAPVRAAFDGVCLLFAGGLLLVPGFVTDGLGLILFVPPVRTLLFHWILRRAEIHVATAERAPRRTYDVDGSFRDVSENGKDDDRILPP